MKLPIAVAISLLSVLASIAAGQNCESCERADKLTKCTKDWVDAVNECLISSCSNHFPSNPILSCTQIPNAPSSTGTTSAKSTTHATITTSAVSTTGSAVTTTTAKGGAATGGVVGIMEIVAALGLGGLAIL